MYAYIKGFIKEIESDYIVVDNNGVGYLIYTASPYSFEIDKEYTVYLYQYVREDEITLYGFKSLEEKQLFLKLISVKGLGCKMALPMLALGSPDGIVDAIERENILYLKKFPKIGDKVARQIILDLKGKLAKTEQVNNQTSDELVEALRSLGYKNADINKVVKKVDSTLDIEEQIKNVVHKLRPYLQRDGGDIEYVDFKDGIVYVRMLGACAGCNMIDDTLKDGVEQILMEEVPGVLEVQNISSAL